MPQSKEYLQYVLEQLDSLRGVVSRRMFGGAGLYQDEVFFGLLFRDTLYFKVNDGNRADYESRGMARFQPYPDKPYLSFTYYEVPADVLEDREELTSWARRAIAAALATAAEKRSRKRRVALDPATRKRRAARKPPQPSMDGTTANRAASKRHAPSKYAEPRDGRTAATRAAARNSNAVGKRATAKKKLRAKRSPRPR